MKNLVDMHMHSTASDGKDTPQELWEKVKAAGLEVFSLTDHDTLQGTMEMEKLVKADKSAVKYIRGIEFSCITPIEKCHILAYDFDYNNEFFQAMVQQSSDMRRKKFQQRIDFLADHYGIRFSDGDMEAMLRIGSVGKPHIAELMVKRGMADSLNDAIKSYINNCPTMDMRIPSEDVIHAIRAAGGVPVWAHPYGGVGEKRLSKEKFEAQLEFLKTTGLMGLECYYSRYNLKEVNELLNYARENELYVSAGSDYHGRNRFPALATLNDEGVIIPKAEITILQAFDK